MSLFSLRKFPFFLLGLLVLCAAGFALYRWAFQPDERTVRIPPPSDPRLVYDGPYRNIQPDVKYVGDAQCVSCHDPECEKFHNHPMGRSIIPTSRWAADPPDKPAERAPLEAANARFVVEQQGRRV